MKRRFFVLAVSMLMIFMVSSVASGSVEINEANFPDANFRAYVSSDCDANHDGILSDDEIAAVDSIDVHGSSIASLQGIEYFTALQTLICSSNDLTSLDVSNCTSMTILNCEENSITELNFNNNDAMRYLSCYNNQITTLDLSNNPSLFRLYCTGNPLTGLDVSTNLSLDIIYCEYNELVSLDVSKNALLVELHCRGNYFAELDLSNNPLLEVVSCDGQAFTVTNLETNSDDASYPYKLDLNAVRTERKISVDVYDFVSRLVTSPDVTDSSGNTVTWSPDVEAGIVYFNTVPRTITYSYNTMNSAATTYMDVTVNVTSSGGGATFKLTISKPDISVMIGNEDTAVLYPENASGDVTYSSNVDWVTVNSSGIVTISPTDSSLIGTNYVTITATDGSSTATVTLTINVISSGGGSGVTLNNSNFPDANFLAYLLNASFDLNSDGYLDSDEIGAVTNIDVHSQDISSLEGIELFTSLTYLDCSSNDLTSLDVSALTALETLICFANRLTSLDMTYNTELLYLWCWSNKITALDVTKNTKLLLLHCSDNQLTELDVTKNTELQNLDCNDNQLTELNVTQNKELLYLYCDLNQLTTLDVSQNTSLDMLECYNNLLTSLDVSKNTNLISLDCSANQLTSLDVSSNTSLDVLNCWDNQLTELDVSKNINLHELYCGINQLDTLDVTQNINLYRLAFNNNKLTTIDVTKNTYLQYLDCNVNQLTSLDVTQNTNLQTLLCWDNQLAELDLSYNTMLTAVSCDSQAFTVTNLERNLDDEALPYKLDLNAIRSERGISVDVQTFVSRFVTTPPDVTDSSNNGVDISPDIEAGIVYFKAIPQTISYNYNTMNPATTTYMDVTVTVDSSSLASADLTLSANTTSVSVVVNSSDNSISLTPGNVQGTVTYSSSESWVTVNSSGDVTISPTGKSLVGTHSVTITAYDSPHSSGYDTATVTLTITVTYSGSGSNIALDDKNFPDATFLSYLKASFDQNGHGYLTIDEIGSITEINVYSKDITSLEGIELFTSLTYLDCSSNDLTELDVSALTALETLICWGNLLTSLDVTNNPNLQTLECWNNQIAALDLTQNVNLVNLDCGNNRLTELDLIGNSELFNLDCYGNQLTTLDLSYNTKLATLDCSGNYLASLDVTVNTELTYLSLGGNQFTSVDLSYNTKLERLECYGSQLTELDVTQNISLDHLYCVDNSKLTSLDLSQNKNLYYLYFYNNDQFTNLDLSLNTNLYHLYCFSNSQLTTLTLPQGTNNLRYLTCNNNDQLTSLDVSQNTNLVRMDCNYNDQLTDITLPQGTNSLQYLDCYGNSKLTTLDVTQNTNLENLYCWSNKLTELDVTKNTKLTSLSCENNKLTTLDVSQNTNLYNLSCYDNQLTTLTLPQGTNDLRYLYCWNNQLTTLDTTKNTNLRSLECYTNLLTAIDVTQNTNLHSLNCWSNDLTALDVTKNTKLDYLNCGSNPLGTLNVTQNTNLYSLYCYNDQLTTLDVTRNTNLRYLSCYSNQLTALDVSKNTELRHLDCDNNQITELDLTHNKLTYLDVRYNTTLQNLDCSGQQLTVLDLSTNTGLQALSCNNQALTLTQVHKLESNDTYSYYVDLYNCMSELGTYYWNLSTYASNVLSMDVRDSSGSSVTYYRDTSSGIVYFVSLPKTVKYYYNVQNPNDSTALMDVTVTLELVDEESDNPTPPTPTPDPDPTPTPTGINGISITAPEGKSVTLPSTGGNFTASVTASGTASGTITWSVSGDERLNLTITGNGNTASLSGTAPANTASEDVTYSVVVSALDGLYVLYTDTLTITVQKEEHITGLTLDTTSVTLTAEGGNFSVIASVIGTPSGSLVWTVSYDEAITAEIVKNEDEETSVTVSGTAPANSTLNDAVYSVTVYVSDNSNVLYTESFNVIVQGAEEVEPGTISFSASTVILSSDGGDFTVTATLSGAASDDVSWSVNAESGVTASISGTGTTATISGSAPGNDSATEDKSYTVEVLADDGVNNVVSEFTVTVSRKSTGGGGGGTESDDNKGGGDNPTPVDPVDPTQEGGSSSNPKRLTSISDFLSLLFNINSGNEPRGRYYRIDADMDFTGTNFTPIGSGSPFTGHFNGNGHTIRYSHPLGLFLAINSDGVAVENLNVVAASSSSASVSAAAAASEPSQYSGGIVSELQNGTIQNCTFSGSVSAPSDDDNASAGGIAGMVSGGEIVNCRVLTGSTVYASSFAGGIAGYVSGGRIAQCQSNANVRAVPIDGYVGGIAGYTETDEVRRNITANEFTGAELEVGNDNEQPEVGITGISIRSGDITLTSNGGIFEFIVDVLGEASGDVVWTVSCDEGVTASVSSSDSKAAVISGRAPRNTNTYSLEFRVRVYAHDDVNEHTGSITVIVNPRPRTIDPEPVRSDDVPVSVRRGVLSSFPGLNESEIYYFTDGEFTYDWDISDNDINIINGRNEQIAVKLPRMMPNNTGVYIIRCVLTDATAGVKLKFYGISDGNMTSIGSAAIENLEYKLLDSDGNEIDTVPEDKVVYVAVRLTAGSRRGGVLTVPKELSIGTIVPVDPEELSYGVLEKIADSLNLDPDEEIKFITEDNVSTSDTEDPTYEMKQEASRRRQTFVGKLDTLIASEDGYYIVKVELSDELYEQLKNVRAKDLRIRAFERNSSTDDASVRSAIPVVYGFLNTWELFSLTGDEMDFTLKTFLMVGFLQAAEPLSLYVLKMILMLLAGCDGGAIGLYGLGVLVGGIVMIKFIRNKKKD